MAGLAQLRRWFQRATAYERITSLAVVAVALALLVASTALRPDDVATIAADASGGAGPAGTLGPGEVGGGGGLVDGGSGGLGSGSPADAGGSDAGAGSTGTAGAGGGGAGAAPVAPIASDRGVTADSITVGFIVQNPSGLSDTGFSTGQRRDAAPFVQAMAAWANAQGGLNGRTIRAVLRPTDPTNVEDQFAACRAMVDDVQAFGVVDVGGLLDTASLDCVTNRTKGDTPLVHSVMWSTAWQARSGGNEVSYQAAVDRIAVTWVKELEALRWFPEGATVGIVGDKCPATEPVITGVLGPALERAGAGKVVYGNHDCNIAAVVGDPPNIATRFRLEGVSHVLIVSNFAAAQIFMTTAKSQGYTPRYTTSDWFLNTSNSTSANFPPDQFDGSIGVASIGAMLRPSGMAPYPGWEVCSTIATDAGLAPMEPDDASSNELLGLCDNFLLFLDALRGAGPNPTRASWRAAVTRLGQRTSVVFGPSRFGPGKLSGSDTVHLVQWRAGCRCWRAISDHRPAAA